MLLVEIHEIVVVVAIVDVFGGGDLFEESICGDRRSLIGVRGYCVGNIDCNQLVGFNMRKGLLFSIVPFDHERVYLLDAAQAKMGDVFHTGEVAAVRVILIRLPLPMTVIDGGDSAKAIPIAAVAFVTDLKIMGRGGVVVA